MSKDMNEISDEEILKDMMKEGVSYKEKILQIYDYFKNHPSEITEKMRKLYLQISQYNCYRCDSDWGEDEYHYMYVDELYALITAKTN